jgi:molecular chaperone HscB
MQYYEALGLAPKLALDPEDLKQRFYQRSREWHPDKFSRAPEQQRQKALDMTAQINDAYRTLREPVSRAEYFLKENGLEISKDVPAELLEEVFELNMALEELRGGDNSVLPQLESARDGFAAMLARIDAELAEQFARHDAGGGPAALDEIRGALNRRRYISNLVRDVEKELNVHLSN